MLPAFLELGWWSARTRHHGHGDRLVMNAAAVDQPASLLELVKDPRSTPRTPADPAAPQAPSMEAKLLPIKDLER